MTEIVSKQEVIQTVSKREVIHSLQAWWSDPQSSNNYEVIQIEVIHIVFKHIKVTCVDSLHTRGDVWSDPDRFQT